MSPSNENLADLIERYIRGGMGSEERATFELNMQSDATLKQQVEVELAIQALMVEEGLKDIRQMIQTDFNNARNINRGKWLGIIFITATLASLLVYLFLKNTPESLSGNTITNGALVEEKESDRNPSNASKSETSKSFSERKSNSSTRPEPHVSKDKKDYAQEKTSTDESNTTESSREIKNETPESKATSVREEKSCDNFKPEYRIATEPSVVNTSTGKLHVISNNKRLKFALNQSSADYLNTFEELQAGVYTLRISDDAGCSTTQSGIKIGSTHCMNNAAQKFSLSDETHEFALVLDDLSEIQIFDKQNQNVRTIRKEDISRWDGKNNNGVIVETGLYSIIGFYTNGEKCYYSLTVFN